jgi:hypothetical protein
MFIVLPILCVIGLAAIIRIIYLQEIKKGSMMEERYNAAQDGSDDLIIWYRDAIDRKLNTIKKGVVFFVVLTIIGLAVSAVALIWSIVNIVQAAQMLQSIW